MHMTRSWSLCAHVCCDEKRRFRVLLDCMSLDVLRILARHGKMPFEPRRGLLRIGVGSIGTKSKEPFIQTVFREAITIRYI